MGDTDVLPPSHKDGEKAMNVDGDNFALVLTLLQLLAAEFITSPEELGQRRRDLPPDLFNLLSRAYWTGGRTVTAKLLVEEFRRHLAELA